MSKRLTIITPVFNEAAGLTEFLQHLDAVAATIESEFPVRVDYVFIDDGSADATFEMLRAQHFTRPAQVLRLSRNFGKEAALSAGVDAAAGADAAVLIDADLQHPPAMIQDFVRIWLEQGANSVYAYKATRRESEGLFKALFSRFFYWVINKGARFHIPANAGDFRLVDHRFMAALRALPESERFMKGLYGWIGFKQVGLPFTPAPRKHGFSSFSSLKLLILTLDALTSFSTAPLRLMAAAGGVIALLSGLYGAYIIAERLFFPGIPAGVASVIALVSFFGGMQMIFLGVLGEYVGKAVSEAKKRPSYIVAETVRFGEGADDPDRG